MFQPRLSGDVVAQLGLPTGGKYKIPAAGLIGVGTGAESWAQELNRREAARKKTYLMKEALFGIGYP